MVLLVVAVVRLQPLLIAVVAFCLSSTTCCISGFHINKNPIVVAPLRRELFGSFDYEYIPPNTDNDGDDSVLGTTTTTTTAAIGDNYLTSSFPRGTPAGLRGEAIRSALARSDRCVIWKLTDTPLEHGVLQVSGKGTLDFLNSKFSQSFTYSSSSSISSDASSSAPIFKEACLLTPKGWIIDLIGVTVMADSETAFLLTSPGHTSQQLLDRLDPFIFPMDQVKLTDCGSDLVVLVSDQKENIQRCFENHILPKIGNLKEEKKRIELPPRGQALHLPLQNDGNGEESNSSLLIVPTCGLPSCVGAGYTFCFLNDDPDKSVGEAVWQYLISEDECAEGPVQAGALEFETLRIESARPAYDKEMTGHKKKDDNANTTPASPLELHLQATVDPEKGCYLGQEGIASIVKNPRGPPRCLYQVVFEDEFNIYDHETKGEFTSSKMIENLTRVPVPGDKLFVLGSNEQIPVGTLTSVAEPSGTADPVTLALALVRRPDSIQKQMKQMSLVVPRPVLYAGDGIIPPPPLDPLDGLEVIVGGTFTVGQLKVVPSRRRGNLFDDDVPDFVKDLPGNDSQKDIIDLSRPREEDKSAAIDAFKVDDDDDDEEDEAEAEAKQLEELAKAKAEADAAAAEAKRKADKMEMLKKRAEEAMARRKQKKAGGS